MITLSFSLFTPTQVSEESTAATTHCLCTHLTSFGTGVFVAPNQIHFDTVFDNLDAKIADNYAVVIALSVVYFLYFVGLVWARRMDRKDVEKVRCGNIYDIYLCRRALR